MLTGHVVSFQPPTQVVKTTYKLKARADKAACKYLFKPALHVPTLSSHIKISNDILNVTKGQTQSTAYGDNEVVIVLRNTFLHRNVIITCGMYLFSL